MMELNVLPHWKKERRRHPWQLFLLSPLRDAIHCCHDGCCCTGKCVPQNKNRKHEHLFNFTFTTDWSRVNIKVTRPRSPPALERLRRMNSEIIGINVISIHQPPGVLFKDSSTKTKATQTDMVGEPEVRIQGAATDIFQQTGSRLALVDVPVLDEHAVQYPLDNEGYCLELGAGAFGVCYSAFLESICEPVVVKSSHYEENDIMREARIQMLLQDSGFVPRIHGIIRNGQYLSSIAIVQETFAEGNTLFSVLASGLPLEQSAWLSICFQLAYGLKAIHERCVLHNDIKTNNVLLDTSSPCPKIKYIDFGLSTYFQAHTYEVSKERKDKCHHLAPEVLNGKPTSTASDVFSLGYCFKQIMARNANLDIRDVVEFCMRDLASQRPTTDFICNTISEKMSDTNTRSRRA